MSYENMATQELLASERRLLNLISIAVLGLIILPVGIACVVLGFGLGDSPCIMCWAERITMIAIALVGLFILRYGIKKIYLVSLMLLACWGLFNGLLHYSIDGLWGGYLDIGQGFGLKILGAHTQFWVMVVDFCVLVFLALILLFTPNLGQMMAKSEAGQYGRYLGLNRLSKSAFIAFIIITSLNALQAYITSGYPPFLASSTPARMSLDPQKWFWEQDHWQSEADWRADWNPDLPDLPK
ncbi:disulfide bond formation protein B [Campylobacter sp. 19-13652]|uniref:disulfide bond formation protein B n=1 Tax=Campylobacter sp. 19-13652 TaxID=2840180 RepID=UPI001C7886EF|nr:disulfide bond formation protein B [Campylobacter sp. 19-13652]BCX79938.1 hypothetical protein LBC_14000 [Campylobacter sp. 19-13652]